MAFNIGDSVIDLTSERKGTIVKVYPPKRGLQMYDVTFDGSSTPEKVMAESLMADCNITDPIERCRMGMYGSFAEFSKINTTFKISNSNNSSISSLKASRTLFRAYQFKPLLKFLNSDNKRLLIADEVGLGKTIEAGHIMLELKARNRLKNVLIVCPKSLQEKWRDELHEKFGLDFRICESYKDFIESFRSGDGNFKYIVNYDKVRDYKGSEPKSNNLIAFLEEAKKHFSLVLCDEAHKLRNNTTLWHRGIRKILRMSESAVFLTATPIMISQENLFNLLNLLDEERFNNYIQFENALRENQPFLDALSDIRSKMTLPEVADKLLNQEIYTAYTPNDPNSGRRHVVADYFKDVPLFIRMIDMMKHEEDTHALRAKIQQDLTTMNPMNNIFSRTRKRDVTTEWTQAKREPHTEIIDLTPKERALFDAIIELYEEDNTEINWYGEETLSAGAQLGLISKKRQIASSVYGYLNTFDDLMNGIDRYKDERDQKVDILRLIIKRVFEEGGIRKIIIFANFKKTLLYLKIRLEKMGYHCALIHGQIKNREDELKKFKNDPNVEILLSSEVGGEGLDLQFCSSMVNYDLPWNPMVVEQRIGRIDRFGQKSEVVNIYNLVISKSIQEEIYKRLLERIGIFRNSIGDLEAILDATLEKDLGLPYDNLQEWYNSLEKELFCNKLTEEERDKKIDEIAQAIENEKINLKKIEEGLTNTLTNDFYFKSEIDRIVNNNAYVTGAELANYFETVINEKLTTCQMTRMDNGIYEFKIPKSNPRVFSSFLTTYQPSGSDFDILFQHFKNQIIDETTLYLTFDQEAAFEDKQVHFVNLYHPIIHACLNYFQGKDDAKDNTFMFDLPSSCINDKLETGQYFLSVYQVDYSRRVYGDERHTKMLLPVLYDISSESVVEDENLADMVLGISQSQGQFHNMRPNEVQPTSDDIDYMNILTTRYVDHWRADYKKEAETTHQNDCMLQSRRIEDYYRPRLEAVEREIRLREYNVDWIIQSEDKKAIAEAKGALQLAHNRYNSLKKDKEEQLALVSQDPKLSVKAEIVSVNLFNVI